MLHCSNYAITTTSKIEWAFGVDDKATPEQLGLTRWPDESEEMLAELPISLRLQLDLVLNRDIFLKVPFFKNCDTSFLIVLVPRIHREYAWWGKTVVHEGLFATGLHMLARGFCKVTKGGRLSTLLTTDDYFGEGTLLSDVASASTIATVTVSQSDR